MVRDLLDFYGSNPLFSQFGVAIDKLEDGSGLQIENADQGIPKSLIQTDDPPQYQGAEHLPTILRAIIQRLCIRFAYTKYDTMETTERHAMPLMLKEYRGRWYVVVEECEEIGSRKAFAMDRIADLEVTEDGFEYPTDFDPRMHFKDVIGVMRGDGSPIPIQLWFSSSQSGYLGSLKLHSSQVPKEEHDNGFVIELTIVPNYEFEAILLGYGADVRVLSPESVALQHQELLRKALAGYENG